MNIGGGVSDWYRGIDLVTVAPGGTVDQENDIATTGNSTGMSSYPGGSGQTVTFGSSPSEVQDVRIRMFGAATRPRGLVRAAFYALSGGVPTGAPLSTSPFYALDSLATSPGDEYYFSMSPWTPSASTAYGLAFQYYNAFNQVNGLAYPSNNDVYAGGGLVFSTKYAASDIDADQTGWSAAPGTDLSFTVYSVSGSGGGGGGGSDPLETVRLPRGPGGRYRFLGSKK